MLRYILCGLKMSEYLYGYKIVIWGSNNAVVSSKHYALNKLT